MVEGGKHVHVAAPSPSLVLDTSRDVEDIELISPSKFVKALSWVLALVL